MPVAVEALDHLVMNVKDVETAAAWYERVLGMKRVVAEPRPGRPVTSMHFGRQKINLRPETATQKQWFTGRLDFAMEATIWPTIDAAAGRRPFQELRRRYRGRAGESGRWARSCRLMPRPDGNLIEVVLQVGRFPGLRGYVASYVDHVIFRARDQDRAKSTA
jgi:catechol 2,3-dioxygenase-like lactoylglutathione lyase family enzyme